MDIIGAPSTPGDNKRILISLDVIDAQTFLNWLQKFRWNSSDKELCRVLEEAIVRLSHRALTGEP